MTRLAILMMVLMLEGPLATHPSAQQITAGLASQYAHGVMERVIVNRQRWGQLPRDLSRYDGFVAVPHARDIGREYWIRPKGGVHWERFLAVDCGGAEDGGRDWMLRNGILFEVDHTTAVRWRTVGRGIHVESWPVFDKSGAVRVYAIEQ